MAKNPLSRMLQSCARVAAMAATEDPQPPHSKKRRTLRSILHLNSNQILIKQIHETEIAIPIISHE